MSCQVAKSYQTLLFQFSQGTFLVGQPAQGSGKPGVSSSVSQAASSTAGVTQQAIRVTAGQKAAILAQVSTSIICFLCSFFFLLSSKNVLNYFKFSVSNFQR